jgi:hypothetical protein
MKKDDFLECFILSGAAFVPEDARTARVFLTNGSSFLMKYQGRTLLSWVHQYFGTDAVQLKRNYSRVLGSRYMVPFIFATDWVLFPLKVLRESELMHGWFLHRAVRTFNPKKQCIELEGGHVISVYESADSFSRQMQKVHLCQYYLYDFQRRLNSKIDDFAIRME